MRHFLVNVFYNRQFAEAQRQAKSGGAPLPESHEKIRVEHVACVENLAAQGTVLCAGPLLNGEGGMFVLAVESEEAARGLMEVEPYVVHGIFERYELIEFERHQ